MWIGNKIVGPAKWILSAKPGNLISVNGTQDEDPTSEVVF